MHLAFTTDDLSNTTLVNAATRNPIYEVLSSPPDSNSRFTTLRHSPTEGKQRWEGKFVGSIAWAEGLLDADEREQGRQEGWFVWARPEGAKIELATLLRPIEGKGKHARVVSGHMRVDYVWAFKPRKLSHKPHILQLTPLNAPEPIVTYYAPNPTVTRSLSRSASSKPRRSFSLSRPASRAEAVKAQEAPAEPDTPYGYLDVSPQALPMLDLAVLTFLVMALSPSTASVSGSGSGRQSVNSPSACTPKGRIATRSTGSSNDPSSPNHEPNGTPSPPTPSDEGPVIRTEQDEWRMLAPEPQVQEHKNAGWSKFLALRSPGLTTGLESGMQRLRRLSLPRMGRHQV